MEKEIWVSVLTTIEVVLQMIGNSVQKLDYAKFLLQKKLRNFVISIILSVVLFSSLWISLLCILFLYLLQLHLSYLLATAAIAGVNFILLIIVLIYANITKHKIEQSQLFETTTLFSQVVHALKNLLQNKPS
mgnify:CR=1 FL=1